jgi:cytochrome P450
MRARKRIISVLRDLIESEKKILSAEHEKTSPSAVRLEGLLAKLVRASDNENQQLSADEITDNLLTIIFAASDTTASAATSIWTRLSLDPNLKARLASSQDPEDFTKLVNQVLQCYPPAPFSFRKNTGDDDVVLGGYRVPCNFLLVYGFAGAQLSEGNAGTDASPADSSLSFGAGPRRCPGRFLASMELAIFAKQLSQKHWELDPVQNLTQTYSPGFFPVDGLKLKMQ